MPTVLTSGPVYIEPKYRNADNRFGLLISNLTTVDNVEVIVKIYAAQFTKTNTRESLLQIREASHTINDKQLLNLVFNIPIHYPYYVFFFSFTGMFPCIEQSLYLLYNQRNAVQDFPLILTDDWLPTP